MRAIKHGGLVARWLMHLMCYVQLLNFFQ